MKKKMYALLLATILVAGVSAAAIASSVSGNDVSGNALPTPAPVPPEVEELGRAVTVSGSGLVVTAVSLDMLNHMKDLRANNTDDFNVTYNLPRDARLVAAFNLNLRPGESMPAGGLIVPIRVNGAKAGDYVIVLHRKADYIWEVVARDFLTGDLTVNATFTSFSPVMVLLVTAEEAAAGGITSPGTSD
ncbi:MAG: hypothetical protein LBI54_09370 [Lachnospiraceae bacterium]|jgi:hypothetical protein|nr:hypothetical protein [Lachnospiraceae bacterium]